MRCMTQKLPLFVCNINLKAPVQNEEANLSELDELEPNMCILLD